MIAPDFSGSPDRIITKTPTENARVFSCAMEIRLLPLEWTRRPCGDRMGRLWSARNIHCRTRRQNRLQACWPITDETYSAVKREIEKALRS